MSLKTVERITFYVTFTVEYAIFLIEQLTGIEV